MDQDIKKHIQTGEILGRYLTNQPEADETSEMEEWLEQDEQHRKLFEEITRTDFVSERHEFHKSIRSETEYALFRQKRQRKTILRYLGYGIPAAACLLIGILIWNFSVQEPSARPVPSVLAQNTILPGSSKAILILENDQTVELGQEKESITSNGNIVADLKDAQLSYRNTQTSGNISPRHRLVTPIGGEYQLQLSDGTKVWLNAGSELSYPIVFSGPEREVSLTGEAYFEVATDKSRPFRVHSDKFDVVVTGTAFNISVYPEEKEHQIALVHGGVNILSGQKLLSKLQPGKQLEYNVENGYYSVSDADLESITAWKNGLFLFRDENLSSITKKLGRWYNVDFKIRTGLTPHQQYSGTIKRDESLENTLNILKLTNEIDFKIKNEREIEIIPLK